MEKQEAGREKNSTNQIEREKMSTRIYVFKDTDEKIEAMAEVTKFTKAEIVMLAINKMYERRIKNE